jgi:hypothetical protein
MTTKRPVLIVRRLRDLQIRQCARCGEDVAVFPAAQLALKRLPQAEIVCMDCQPPAEGDVGLSAVR